MRAKVLLCLHFVVCFLLTQLVYSRLTGYDLGFEGFSSYRILGSCLFYIYFMVILGVWANIYFRIHEAMRIKFASYAGSLLTALCLTVLFIIIIVHLYDGKLLDFGRSIRFYASDILKYFVPFLTIGCLLFSLKISFQDNHDMLLVSLVKAACLHGIGFCLLGVGYYWLKIVMKLDRFALPASSTLSQLVITFLCLIMPSFCFIFGTVVILRILHKHQSIEGKKILFFLCVLGSSIFPLFSSFPAIIGWLI